MTWQQFSDNGRPLITKTIEYQCRSLEQLPVPNARLFAARLLDYTCKGKLLRANFLRLSALTFCDSASEEILNMVGGCIELAQSAFLVHDDIIDQDAIRRNAPAMHKLFEKDIKPQNANYGEAQAICMGDMVLTHLFSFLSEYPELIRLFSKTLTLTALGQAQEIQWGTQNQEISLDQIYQIIEYKTAHYTFVLPFLSGLILSGTATHQKTVLLTKLGIIMGYIFQIRDDELNLLAPSELNKSAGSDITENKKTLCRYELIKEFPEAADLFGHSEKIIEVQKLYKNSMAEKMIQNYILKFVAEAKNLFEYLEIKKEWRSIWKELLNSLYERQL